MIDESVPVSKSVIFIANILVIAISVILHIGAPLMHTSLFTVYFIPLLDSTFNEDQLDKANM